MVERIIVSLTTWSKRIQNIPIVLDTIFNQTLPPDFVVINLAYEEVVPENIQQYIDEHDIEVNRVPDTKVYKKLIPTLKRYPNDCIITIDDDFLYPAGMIEDFINMHKKYPQHPITGNRAVMGGMLCHCGCASLVMASHFGNQFDNIDADVLSHCTSDDVVYTYFANKAGHPYINSTGLYFYNMTQYNNVDGYSAENIDFQNGIQESLDYLVSRFGSISNFFSGYVPDAYIAHILQTLCAQSVEREILDKARKEITDTTTFKLGYMLLTPIRWLKKTRIRMKL